VSGRLSAGQSSMASQKRTERKRKFFVDKFTQRR
jgi:hypothetical protein